MIEYEAYMTYYTNDGIEYPVGRIYYNLDSALDSIKNSSKAFAVKLISPPSKEAEEEAIRLFMAYGPLGSYEEEDGIYNNDAELHRAMLRAGACIVGRTLSRNHGGVLAIRPRVEDNKIIDTNSQPEEQ